METNTATIEKSKSPIGKRNIAILVLICIIAGGLSWYFLYFTKTPEYSLNLIRESIEKHDVAKFNKHIDLDSTLSRGYDDLMAAMVESDKTMTPEAKTFVGGFAQMFKAPVVTGLKDGITRFVETGKWEAKKDDQQAATKKENQPNINPDKIADKSGLKNSSFKGIAYTKKDGKTATVGLKVFEKDVNQEFIIDVKMRELDDGTWQVAEISNFKEYILDIEKAKNELMKKYIEDTQPIVDKHNKIASEIDSKIKSIIASSNLADPNKIAELKNIIANELITDWNIRVEELNKISVPEAAKEIHNLRLKVCELRIKQFDKNIEWLDNKSPQTMKEINTLAQQANKANQQVVSTINKVKAETN